jgi:hypothetical protein
LSNRRRLAPSIWIPLLALAGAVPTGAATAQESSETAAEETVLGSASSLSIDGSAAETVEIEAGSRLYETPHRHGAAVTIVDVTIPLPVLERRDDWVKVRFGERQGWAFLGEEEDELPSDADELLLENLPPPPPPPPPPTARPDAERLAHAISLLDSPPTPVQAGPFTLFRPRRDLP